MPVKQWIVQSGDRDLAAEFAQRFQLNPFASLLAVSRGIETPEQMQAFFCPEQVPLSDPFDYKDMDKAAARINDAIDNFERIAVFGDYDADGVTATALLCAYFDMREADYFYMLPERTEGYGLNETVIRRLHERGAKLIVTVDNGISSVREAELARSLGMDMVITDHHQVGDELPDAAAVVNPHRPDSGGFSDLAGVGVAFKLVCALENGEADEDLLEEYGDLVAIGTVADIVPLIGENRRIVGCGIRRMIEEPRPGVLAMREASGTLDRPFNAGAVAFTLSPRLNAAGRMHSAVKALELLLCEDPDDARELAKYMEDANAERQRIEQQILQKAQQQLQEHPERLLDRVLVCDGDGWHQGVIGIVASRMVEQYGKPCIILSCTGDVARGSGRSIEGFSLYDALKACEECLEQFGGHTQAAGLTVLSANIDAFRAAVNRYADGQPLSFPVQRVDMRLNPKSISTEILDGLAALEPFGAGNPKPVFGLFNMRLDAVSGMSGGKHLRLTLSKNGARVTAVRFGVSPESFPFPVGSLIDVAVTLEANEYMGETRVSVLIKAVRYSLLGEDAYLDGLRALEGIRRGKASRGVGTEMVPDRTFIAVVYKALRGMGGVCRSADALCVHLQMQGAQICPMHLALDAMCELSLAEKLPDGSIRLLETDQKVNLDDSVILRNARSCLQ